VTDVRYVNARLGSNWGPINSVCVVSTGVVRVPFSVSRTPDREPRLQAARPWKRGAHGLSAVRREAVDATGHLIRVEAGHQSPLVEVLQKSPDVAQLKPRRALSGHAPEFARGSGHRQCMRHGAFLAALFHPTDVVPGV
jgi:hypothetical protein